jgi:hypothetical protein
MNGLSDKDLWTLNILKVKPYVDFKNLQQEKDFSRQLKRAKPDNLLSKFFNIILKLIDDKPVINHDSQEIKDLKRENTLLQKQNLEYKLELETYKNTRRANKLLSEKNQELKDEIFELTRKIKMLQSKNKVDNNPSVFDQIEIPKIIGSKAPQRETPKIVETPIRYDNSTDKTDYFYKLDCEEKQLSDYTDEEIYHTMKSLELTKEQWDKTSDTHKKIFLLDNSIPADQKVDYKKINPKTKYIEKCK